MKHSINTIFVQAKYGGGGQYPDKLWGRDTSVEQLATRTVLIMELSTREIVTELQERLYRRGGSHKVLSPRPTSPSGSTNLPNTPTDEVPLPGSFDPKRGGVHITKHLEDTAGGKKPLDRTGPTQETRYQAPDAQGRQMGALPKGKINSDGQTIVVKTPKLAKSK